MVKFRYRQRWRTAFCCCDSPIASKTHWDLGRQLWGLERARILSSRHCTKCGHLYVVDLAQFSKPPHDIGSTYIDDRAINSTDRTKIEEIVATAEEIEAAFNRGYYIKEA